MEKQLIVRAKRGDHAAFDRLIELHRETMFRYAYLIVRDAAIAEDVTQDAVLSIYRALDKVDENRPFRAWAISITRNLARNNNRSWGRYKHALTRLFTYFEQQHTSIEILTHQQQQASDLHEAVATLQADFQDVIYARYFLSLSVEETADALEIAHGTVKSRSHRALTQLRRVIERDYPHLAEDYQHA